MLVVENESAMTPYFEEVLLPKLERHDIRSEVIKTKPLESLFLQKVSSIQEQNQAQIKNQKVLAFDKFIKKPSFLEINKTPDILSNKSRRTTISR